MKGVVFLLALCAFQIVLANHKSDLDNLHARSINEMNRIVKKLHDDVKAEFEKERRTGLSEGPLQCWHDYNALKALNTRIVNMLITNCYNPALRLTTLQEARQCYAGKIAFIKGKERERRANTIACFQSHNDEEVAIISSLFM